MEVELMVTKRDDDQPTTDRVNIELSALGRMEGRVLQLILLYRNQSQIIHSYSLFFQIENKNFKRKYVNHVNHN